MTGGQFKDGFSLGNDTFTWVKADVVNPNGTSAGFDHITDFGAGDKLDFSGVVSNHNLASAASVVHVTDSAAGTVVSADVGGGHFMDVVLLHGVHGLDIEHLVSSGSLII